MGFTRRAAVLLIPALLSLGPAQAQEQTRFTIPFYTVLLNGGGLGGFVNEVTVISQVPKASGGAQAEFWAAERQRNNHWLRQTVSDHQWIDGRTCPALRAAVDGIEAVAPQPFGGPKRGYGGGPVSDAALTTLRGPSATGPKSPYGALSRSDFDGPISAWRRAAEAKLAGCWRDAPVVVEGVQIRPHLATQAEADSWR